MARNDSEEKVIKDQSLNLNIPNPPSDLSYWEFEDFRNREILKANGISLSEDDLIAALKERRNVLQAAVAHTLGSLSSRPAIPILKDFLASSEDLVKVEAAYALARLGVPEGKEVLVQCLGYPVDAYLFPAIAAGYLAQLGDPQGFNTVVKCFDVDIPAIRMLACKQLYFFVRFQGQQDKDGNPIDVYRLLNRALKDTDTDLQWQALVQLREIRSTISKKILESYAENTQDEKLRDVAREILIKQAE
jgi:HEAT repeat protein